MKKRMTGITLMAAAMLLTACGTQTDDTTAAQSEVSTTVGTEAAQGTVATETLTATEAQTAETTQDPAAVLGTVASYDEIIENYRTMIKEKWDASQIYETDYSPVLSYLTGADNAQDTVGYVYMDINGDGEDELLIGETDTELAANRMIFDAYTLKDGQPVQLFVSHERNRYYLCEDESGAILVANEAANGAANSAWYYYIVSGTELQVVQGVIYDLAADEQNPWFITYDDDWDTSNDEPTTEEDAQNIIDSNTNTYAALDWTPIME